MTDNRVVLITGAAHRLGATTARVLHGTGMNIVLHYRNSRQPAEQLQQELLANRPDSVELLHADLLHINRLPILAEQAEEIWGRLDVLINNASAFYSTPVDTVTETQWDELLGANLKAPFFLSRAAARYLREQEGCIVNIADIHAERPLRNFPVYSISKAGLVMMTQSLAAELGPEIRVNAVAPGAILWPEHLDEAGKEKIISRTFLKRKGEPEDIARAILYLINDAQYMTGQVLAVDGGRSLNS
ncbi:MAG: pteridine reductase [Proteobacteria bacterium]|jgi:pteridine reductase|nr:pteridine reductase [Pseudomonadota bacterium]MCG6935205.1 pteridine reductase [Pseudomonadota bacterium]